MELSKILTAIPDGLRKPLLTEYNTIVQNYLEKRWTSTELSGGRFCEIVYTILDGFGKGVFPSKPSKPSNFVNACKNLESYTHVPRSFQILIPRLLPALYEIRNNRSVGHVGGDVDPNSMDSNAVISMCSWIFGELIRVFHNTSIIEANKIVDYVTNRRIPLIWESENIKRVLNPKISIPNQILLLIASSNKPTSVDDLFNWIDYGNKAYFQKILRKLHHDRFINISNDNKKAEILPPGSQKVEYLISKIK